MPDRTLYEPSLRFALPGGRVRSARDAPRVLKVQWAKRGSRRGTLVVLAIRRENGLCWKGISILPHDSRIFSRDHSFAIFAKTDESLVAHCREARFDRSSEMDSAS